jgi:hypothetical protein
MPDKSRKKKEKENWREDPYYQLREDFKEDLVSSMIEIRSREPAGVF